MSKKMLKIVSDKKFKELEAELGARVLIYEVKVKGMPVTAISSDSTILGRRTLTTSVTLIEQALNSILNEENKYV